LAKGRWVCTLLTFVTFVPVLCPVAPGIFLPRANSTFPMLFPRLISLFGFISCCLPILNLPPGSFLTSGRIVFVPAFVHSVSYENQVPPPTPLGLLTSNSLVFLDLVTWVSLHSDFFATILSLFPFPAVGIFSIFRFSMLIRMWVHDDLSFFCKLTFLIISLEFPDPPHTPSIVIFSFFSFLGVFSVPPVV